MRRYVAVLITFLPISLNAQSDFKTKGLDIYLGYSINKTMMLGVGYVRNANTFYLGIGTQKGGQNGKEIGERLPNYGTTATGKGDFYQGVDIGYDRMVVKKVALGGIISIDNKKYYTNYSDKRFTADGFHEINKKETVFGIGGYMTYVFNLNMGLAAGYHTHKDVFFTIHYRFTN